MGAPDEKKPRAQGDADRGNREKRGMQANYRDDSEKSQIALKYDRIWNSDVTPAGKRLTLLAVARHANADGTNSWPSVSTLARHCKLSDQQVRRYLHDLTAEGILEIQDAKPGRTVTYRINFDALALPTPPADVQTDTDVPPDVDVPDPSRAEAKPIPPTGVNPPYPDYASNQGEGGAAAAASAPPGPSLAGGPGELPPGLDPMVFEVILNRGRSEPLRRDLLIRDAWELHQQRYDLKALAELVIKRPNWCWWPDPDKFTAKEKRSYTRSDASTRTQTGGQRLGSDAQHERYAIKWGTP